jgi:hypothetical protein
LSDRLPDGVEARAAALAASLLRRAQWPSGELRLVVEGRGDERVDLMVPVALAELMAQVLSVVGRGSAVEIRETPAAISVDHAAHLLDVPVSYLLGLLAKGAIKRSDRLPFRRVLEGVSPEAEGRVSRTTLVSATSVLACRDARKRRRERALAEMAAIDGALLSL